MARENNPASDSRPQCPEQFAQGCCCRFRQLKSQKTWMYSPIKIGANLRHEEPRTKRGIEQRLREQHSRLTPRFLIAFDLIGRRSEEHTSELQSHLNLVCRLLLEK